MYRPHIWTGVFSMSIFIDLMMYFAPGFTMFELNRIMIAYDTEYVLRICIMAIMCLNFMGLIYNHNTEYDMRVPDTITFTAEDLIIITQMSTNIFIYLYLGY